MADELLCPSHKPQTKLIGVNDMGNYFRDKVSIIRATTASCEQPEIIERECDPLTTFETVSVDEITALIRKTPAKSCCLDPIPSWFVKKYMAIFALVLCRLCNLSLETGKFPKTLKCAIVRPRLKSPV